VTAPRTLAVLACLVFVCAADVDAQSRTPAARGRVEVSVGTLWIGHQALGETVANETTGTGSTFRLFTSSSDLAARAGFEGRIAVRVSRSLEAEVNASYAKPQLNISLADDVENATALAATETLQQVTVGAGVVWYLPIRSRTGRLAPFVSGGGGYLRQLHEGATLLETGRFYQVGGGVKYLLFDRARGTVKGFGVRLDARAVLRAGGVAFDDTATAAPAAGVSAFVRF
jgi:hypothetical protein